jgi:hypothetical protein
VRGLDDPANPYRSQYGEWDYWCVANAKPMTGQDWADWSDGKVPATRRMISYGVDKDGFPVPLMEQRRQQIERLHDTTQKPESTCVVSFGVYGDIPPEVDTRMLAAEMALKAPYVPPLPRWLAKQPPLWALVLPNGEIVTAGKLGSGRMFDMSYTRTLKENLPPYKCYRYSAEGKLLGQTETGQQWYTLFWPKAAEVLSQYSPDETIYWIENGYVIVRNFKDWSNAAVFDYDGTPLPADTNTALRDANVWNGWYGREIPLLYEAQQKAGKK